MLIRESVRLEFIIAGTNDLDICNYDIGNAYLNVPFQEKLWTEAISEFGSDKGYFFLIVRALYVLKSPGEAWRYKLEDKLNPMSYRSTDSDPDVWIKRAKTENGTAY